MDDASTRSDADDGSERSASDGASETADSADTTADTTDDAGRQAGAEESDPELAALRERVESEYDFENFGPEDMVRMSREEWDAAFDPDTWITGDRLLDRVEAELKSRIARRELFGILERVREDGTERVLVYSDEGYAMIRSDGAISGQGTVYRDVEPVVALAAMEKYDVPEPPDDWSLPHPDTVPEGSGEFGNLMIQIVAGIQLIAGVILLGAWLLTDLDTVIAPAIAILFLIVGVFLFTMVANARLSDRFRAEEYRNRLRTLRELEERPDFVPIESEKPASEPSTATDVETTGSEGASDDGSPGSAGSDANG